MTSSPPASRAAAEPEPPGRWRQLAVLSIGLLCAMSPSFAASAVAPVLREEWGLDPFGLPILTIAVLLGFAVFAIVLAAAGVPDVVPGPTLFALGAAGAGLANLGFALLATDLASAVPFRVLTGAAEAAAYPVALKMVSGWFRRDRGLAVGIAIGALNLGTASPLLFRAVGVAADVDWRPVIAAASVACFVGAAVVAIWARPGPFDVPSPRFSLQIAARAFREPAVRLANIGYLGHMWELFAMWTWVPLFFVGSFAAAGIDDPGTASIAAFVAVGAGVVGCVAAGAVADRIGRSVTTIIAMITSGTCAVLIGFVFGEAAPIVVALALVWGVAIIADSAQFSAAVSELAPPGTAGSALSLQLASGFVLTALPILIVGAIDPVDASGWRLAFGMLAAGPIVGCLAMWRLRARPESIAMAGGHR
ncbi:MAG TPA: MFS transporter [Candidatus Saccharimonadales bacterium]|nr:MFS transporter [Candidatus Saccharimonadales bacterium]